MSKVIRYNVQPKRESRKSEMRPSEKSHHKKMSPWVERCFVPRLANPGTLGHVGSAQVSGDIDCNMGYLVILRSVSPKYWKKDFKLKPDLQVGLSLATFHESCDAF